MWPAWEHTLLIFAAGLLEGAVGFDFGLIATPALGAAVGVRNAVVLLCLPGLSLSAVRALQSRARTASTVQPETTANSW